MFLSGRDRLQQNRVPGAAAQYGLWPSRFSAHRYCTGTVYVSDGPVMGTKPNRPFLLIGAVDNHLARRELVKAVADGRGRIWCLDIGNAQYNGQILIGNMSDLNRIEFSELGLCSGLPSPYIQEPGLLELEGELVAVSCADLTLREEQSLMVNQAAAAIAAQYCHEFVVRRELWEFATYFNMQPLTSVSKSITEAHLDSFANNLQQDRAGR